MDQLFTVVIVEQSIQLFGNNMRAKFLFIQKKGYGRIFGHAKERVLTFKKGDILLQDEKWGNVYRAVKPSVRNKNHAWVSEPYGMIYENAPLNIKAVWLVIYTKLGQPHYGWYARFFKNVRGY